MRRETRCERKLSRRFFIQVRALAQATTVPCTHTALGEPHRPSIDVQRSARMLCALTRREQRVEECTWHTVWSDPFESAPPLHARALRVRTRRRFRPYRRPRGQKQGPNSSWSQYRSKEQGIHHTVRLDTDRGRPLVGGAIRALRALLRQPRAPRLQRGWAPRASAKEI